MLRWLEGLPDLTQPACWEQDYSEGTGWNSANCTLGKTRASGDRLGMEIVQSRCSQGSQGQASKVSDGHAFLPGRAGCARRHAEDRGMISKRENESRSQSPGQLHAQQALLGTAPCQAAQLAERKGPELLQGLSRMG